MPTRDRAALVLVALTLAFATLALGGAQRWAACIASLLAIASALPYATSRRTSSRPSVLLAPLIVAAGITALQLFPLTAAIAEQLVPRKLELVSDNARAWGDPEPAWVVASFDPPATLVELAKLVGYLALAYTAVRLSANRRARHGLAIVVASVATLAAAIAIVHHVAGATRLYGIYQPSFRPVILGPLLGVNHLAALLGLSVPIALALSIRTSNLRRVGWLIAAATLAATTLLTGSRGGLVGMLAGLIVTVVLLLVQRRSGTSETNRRVPISVMIPAAVVVVCTITLLALFTAGDVARDLSRTSFSEVSEPQSKFQVWSRAIGLTEENRWLGVGRGGFEPAFLPRSETGNVIFSHVENSYLQALIDWGLPASAALLLTLAMVARRAAQRWRHGPLEAGVLGGIAGLAVHDLADFSIEMPAVAMSAIVAAAILLPARLGTENGPTRDATTAARRRLLVVRGCYLTGALTIVLLASSPLGRSARVDAARITEAEDGDRLARARAAQRRHPADAVIAGLAAEALFAKHDQAGVPDARALRLIRRAIAMHPNNAGLHHLAARMLLRSSRPEQAAPEFAEAARWAVDVAPIVADVLQAFREPAAAARAMPSEPRHAERIFAALGARQDVALAYSTRVAELYPREPAVQALLATAALAAGRADLAVPAAKAAWTLHPVAQHGTLLGRAMALSGDRHGAIAHLALAADRDQTSSVFQRCELLFVLADLQIEVSDLEGARATLERAGSIGGDHRSILIDMHLRLATLEDRRGNRNQAEWERNQARALQFE